MKNVVLILLFLIFSFASFAQNKKLYDPKADAEKDIQLAIKQAALENKFVLIQGGGNWCSWCIEFARFCKADKQ